MAGKRTTIHAVVFDVGGVLEDTPGLGVAGRWEARLGLPAGSLGTRLSDVWAAGAVGSISLDQVHRAIAGYLGLRRGQVDAFMAEMWERYLGTPNTELIDYARGLRPRWRTGILSNSFVGAREREQAAYGFGDLVDEIIYSHEAGMAKPDPRLYRLTCSRLGVRPEQMIFLDDGCAAVAGARAVGIHAIRYRSNAQAITEIGAMLARASGPR